MPILGTGHYLRGGGGATKRERGKTSFTPEKKGGGGGCGKRFSHAEGIAQKALG